VFSPRLRAGCAVLALVLAAAWAAGGCTSRDRSGSGASADTTPAAVDSATTDPYPETIPAADLTYETALVPLHSVEIFARLDGEIVALDVEEGRRVRAGDRLAQLDDRERRATLDMREAEVARTESSWQRAQRLHDQKVISEEQFIAVRSEWQIARAQRDRARIDWERCAVRTPIAGLVEQRRVQMGQTVKDGDLLFRIGDPSTLRAELLLPEARLGTVRVGQPVRILPTAGGEATVARVSRVNPLVDPASGTFRVVIDLDNRAGRLHGGVSARVAFDGIPAPATSPR
jgi:membrane fusion protein (multidrug efflux system)